MGDAEQIRLTRDLALQKLKAASQKFNEHTTANRTRQAGTFFRTVKQQFEVFETNHLKYVFKIKEDVADAVHKAKFEEGSEIVGEVEELWDAYCDNQERLERDRDQARVTEEARSNAEAASARTKARLEADLNEALAELRMHIPDGEDEEPADVSSFRRTFGHQIGVLEERMRTSRALVDSLMGEMTADDCRSVLDKRRVADAEFQRGIWAMKKRIGDEGADVLSAPRSRGGSPSRRDNFRHKKVEFPRFSGNIRDFNMFRRDFRDIVVDCGMYDKRHMSHILRSESLTGEARQLVSNIHDYDTIWRKLEEKYDDKGEVIEQISLQLMALKKIDDEDYTGLVKFVDTVERAEMDMKAADSVGVLNNPLTVRSILAKCPTRVREGLIRELALKDASKEFETLMVYLADRRREAIRLARLRDERPAKPATKKGSTNAAVTDPQQKKKGNFTCPVKSCSYNNFHFLSGCRAFKKLSVNERGQVVVQQKMCVFCFDNTHDVTTCPKKAAGWKVCDQSGCGRWHSRLLHGATTPGLSLSICSMGATGGFGGALLLVQAVPVDHGEATVLWDTGSTVSLVRNEFAEKAGLEGTDCQFQLTGVGGQMSDFKTKMYVVPLLNREGKKTVVNAFGIQSITAELEPVVTKKFAQIFGLKNNQLRRPAGEVDLLVGMNHAEFLPVMKQESRGLVLYSSKFGSGYLLGGSVGGAGKEELKNFAHQVCHAGGRAVRHVDFLTAEAFGVDVPKRCKFCRGCKECGFKAHQLTYTENMELQEIEDGLTLDTTRKKWTASYPFHTDPAKLKNNMGQAVACLYSLERRLNKAGQMKNFNEQFQEAVDRGVFKEWQPEEVYDGPINYVTMTEAYKEGENVTTPLRLCMNSSMRYRGLSLNDLMMKGPPALNNIFSVLLNFRAYKVGFVKDVAKFYQSVEAVERDKHLRRVLWRFGKEEQEPQIYTTETINFGDKAAGAVAMTALRQTADLYRNVDGEAAEKLKRDAYVDDITSGADSKEDARRVSSNMEIIANHGGFRFKSTTMTGDKVDPLKVLGTGWDPEKDELFLEVKINASQKKKGHKLAADIDFDKVDEMFPEQLTKRIVWRVVLGQYDLLGLGSVFFIRLKLLMRDLAGDEGRKFEWDQVLPEEYREKFVSLMQLLGEMRKLRFPRALLPSDASRAAIPDLLVFGDGSKQAFCTLAYVRWEDNSGAARCTLVGGKTRVAPLRKISIPRLELLGAVAAVRLAAAIQEAVNFTFRRRYFFTDSTAVYGMIRGECGAFQEFIGTRTGEIKNKSDPLQEWFWIPTDENLADMGTREDVTPAILGPGSAYQTGLEWMTKKPEYWPTSQQPGGQIPAEEMIKVKVMAATAKVVEILDLKKFTSLRKACRILGYVLLAIELFRGRSVEKKLKSQLIVEAEIFLFIQAQKLLKYGLKEGKLTSLLPRWEDVNLRGNVEKLLVTEGRSGGVVQVGYDKPHLPLIPYSHPVAELLMWDAHREGHCGIDRTVLRSRRTAWVIRGRRLARKVVSRCHECRRRRKIVEGQRIAPVPESRLPPSPPFYSTAVDIFGPLEVRDTVKRRTTRKVWGVLFVCTVIGAIHLEVSEDYSTDSFLQCLRRFISLRGTPARFQSDPGTQLVAAAKQVGTWDFSKLEEWAAGARTEWHFIPVNSQHYNGCAEAMIKSTKKQLNACLAEKSFTKGEMDTVLAEISAIINSRPLGRRPGEDVMTGGPITPLHLLSGRASIHTPEVQFSVDSSLVKRLQFIDQTTSEFWRKWHEQVFENLVPNYQWNTQKRNVRVGDVVLVKESNVLKGEYRLAKVKEAKAGSDGRVRRVVLEYKILKKDKNSVKSASDDLKNTQFRTTERSVQSVVIIVPVESVEEIDEQG